MVLALVLGLWGAGAPLISRLALKADLDDNFQRTRPPHLVLTSEQFERLELARLLARPEVEAASLRDFAIHRVEVWPEVWLPLLLYGVDFNDDSVLRRVYQSGQRVPPPGTVLIERDGLRGSRRARAMRRWHRSRACPMWRVWRRGAAVRARSCLARPRRVRGLAWWRSLVTASC